MLISIVHWCKRNKLKTAVTVFAVIATIVRIYIAVHTPMVANMSQLNDDAYFVELGTSLVQGDWLGDYNGFLLQKVPGYAFVLAFCLMTGLPYQLLFCLLEISAAISLLFALRPLRLGQTASCLIYAFLIFSPDLFTWAFFQRTYRMGILIPFIEVMFASYVAIWLRTNGGPILRWIVLLCLSMPVLFLVKEDGIWCLPFAIAATICILVARAINMDRNAPRKANALRIAKHAGTLALPFIVSFACLSLVSLINYQQYGIYSYSDRYDSALTDVCADLVRIEPDDNAPENVWVSRDAMEQAYEASPALASIETELTEARESWSKYGSESDPIMDHSFWALKTAVSNIPELSDASAADSFYSTVHEELLAAFNNGELSAKSGLQISSTVEPIPWSKVPQQLLDSLELMLNFYNGDELLECTAPSAASDGDINLQRKANILINGPIVYADPADPEARIGSIFQGLSYRWVKICTDAMPIAFIIYLIMLALLVANLIRRKPRALSILLVVLGITLTQLIVVFSVSWFCSGLGATAGWATAMYCAPFYPLYEVSFVTLLAYLRAYHPTPSLRQP